MAEFFKNFIAAFKRPIIPPNFRTEHFTNEELCKLANSWGGGNTIDDPTEIGRFAERAYTFKNDKEFFADPDIKMMWRDGLGNFLVECWKMVEKKHTINSANPTLIGVIAYECNVCKKLCKSVEQIDHPLEEHFVVCYNCKNHGYMTNFGWNVGE